MRFLAPSPTSSRPEVGPASPHLDDWDDEPTGVRTLTEIEGVHLEFPLMHYVDARQSLGPMEADYVAWALLAERGNRSATARRLALTRTTFLRHLKRLGLEGLIPEEEAREYVIAQLRRAG